MIPPRSESPAGLIERWQATFHSPAPYRSRSDFLQRALQWHEQMQASPEWRGSAGYAKLLRTLKRQTPKVTLSPGTLLVREWQGTNHQVTVLPTGFEYKGQHHTSLSAIARQITGTAWSGPLFFGLKP